MRSIKQIENIFKEMDLDTQEKRNKYLFSFGYGDEKENIIYNRDVLDSQTEEKDNKNAKLESDT